MAKKKKKKDSFDELQFWFDNTLDELMYAFDNGIDSIRLPDGTSTDGTVFDRFRTPMSFDTFDEFFTVGAVRKREEYFTEYFETMQAPKNEKQRRAKLAEILCEEFIETLIWLYTLSEGDKEYNRSLMEEWYRQDMYSAIEEYIKGGFKGLSDTVAEDVSAHIEKTAIELSDSTERMSLGTDTFSEGRAILIACNEATTIFSNQDYVQALDSGKKYKTWLTQLDEKVRPWHSEVDSKKIPIDEMFVVGGELMLYPKDTDNGASAENTINCRCYCTYT